MLYWSDRSNTVTYFYLLRGVNQSKLVWINGFILHIYLVSQPISHLKIILRETSFGLQILAAKGIPVWPVCPTGLTGLAWQLPFLPLHGLNSETFSLLPLHRHLFPPSTVPLLLTRPRRPPLAIWNYNQGRRVSSWGFGAHHRSDRSPKAVLRFLHQNIGLKVLYTLFFIDLLI